MFPSLLPLSPVESRHKRDVARMLALAKAGFLQYRRARGVSSATLRGYEEGLNQFLGFVLSDRPTATLETIEQDDVERFLVSLRERFYRGRKLSDNTVLNRYRTLLNFFNWCVAQDLLEVSPMRKIKKVREVVHEVAPYSREEIMRLMKATAHFPGTAIRDQAWLSLMYNTGLRAGEVSHLRPQDIDGRFIRVRFGKGKRERSVIMDTVTRSRLDLWLAGREGKRTVFGLSVSGMYQRLRKLAEIANVPGARLHRLRNTFGVEYLRNGGQVSHLQKILGHVDIELTQRYVSYIEQELALEEMARVAPFSHDRPA